MKKILALVMAIVMMMAIAVPAFAAVEKDDGTSGSETLVKVDGTNGGTYEGSWSVTIPAVVNLTWGQNGSEDYEITSQLATDKRVQVTLAKSIDLTSKTDANDVIPFTAAHVVGEDGISDSEVVTDEAHAFNITVEAGEWLDVPYDVYEGQISFTATVVDA